MHNDAYPTGFARATGIVEHQRQCLECGHQYRADNDDLQGKCPKCESKNTIAVKAKSD